MAFGCPASLISSHLWWFLSLLLFFTTLTLLRYTGQVFGRMSLNLSLFDIFLMTRLDYEFWGRILTEVKLPSHCILSGVHGSNMNPQVVV